MPNPGLYPQLATSNIFVYFLLKEQQASLQKYNFSCACAACTHSWQLVIFLNIFYCRNSRPVFKSTTLAALAQPVPTAAATTIVIFVYFLCQERQASLQKYNFSCACAACTHNWPGLTGLPAQLDSLPPSLYIQPPNKINNQVHAATQQDKQPGTFSYPTRLTTRYIQLPNKRNNQVHSATQQD